MKLLFCVFFASYVSVLAGPFSYNRARYWYDQQGVTNDTSGIEVDAQSGVTGGDEGLGPRPTAQDVAGITEATVETWVQAQQALLDKARAPIRAAEQLSILAPILDDHPESETIPEGGMYYRLSGTNGIITLWYVRTQDTIATQLSAHAADGTPIIRTRNLATGEDSTINVAVALQATVRQLVVEDSLSDDELAELVDVFPAWKVGIAYEIGDVRKHGGTLYKCVQAHTSQADWTPDAVPALWTSTAPPSVIPEWVQPTGAQDAYNTGDRVTFEGGIWESTIDANVWSPTAHPAGWTRIGDA